MLLRGPAAQAAVMHEGARNSSAFHLLVLPEVPSTPQHLPFARRDVSWFLALLILVCDEKTTGGTERSCGSIQEEIGVAAGAPVAGREQPPVYRPEPPAVRTNK